MTADNNRIPVILDTDIGSDIDDTWALAMLLKSPELDVKLVVSDTGDTTYRSRVIAKLLEVAGRTDVPVGVGSRFDSPRAYPQESWVKDYDLGDYPGPVVLGRQEQERQRLVVVERAIELLGEELIQLARLARSDRCFDG